MTPLCRALRNCNRHNRALNALREWHPAPAPAPQGALTGWAVCVKDNIGVDGFATWAGTARRLPTAFAHSGALVQRLCAAGATVIGKSHCSEFAFGGSGHNPHHGSPINPWSQSEPLAPGGSSSGAAVAVAAGMAQLALGTDTGGSVRVPAALCGVVGYRASTGHWPMDGMLPLSSRVDSPGLIAPTVAALAQTVAALDGVAAIPARPLAGLRIAAMDPAGLAAAEPAVRAAFERALEALRAAGAALCTGGARSREDAMALLENGPNTAAIECNRLIDERLPDWRGLLSPRVAELLAEHAGCSDETLTERHRALGALQQRRCELFNGATLYASPTCPAPAPPLAALESAAGYAHHSNELLHYTVLGSLFNSCGISLPMDHDPLGRPVGLQLLAASGEDHHLIGAALSIEKALDYRSPPPPRLRSQKNVVAQTNP